MVIGQIILAKRDRELVILIKRLWQNIILIGGPRGRF